MEPRKQTEPLQCCFQAFQMWPLVVRTPSLSSRFFKSIPGAFRVLIPKTLKYLPTLNLEVCIRLLEASLSYSLCKARVKSHSTSGLLIWDFLYYLFPKDLQQRHLYLVKSQFGLETCTLCKCNKVNKTFCWRNILQCFESLGNIKYSTTTFFDSAHGHERCPQIPINLFVCF